MKVKQLVESISTLSNQDREVVSLFDYASDQCICPRTVLSVEEGKRFDMLGCYIVYSDICRCDDEKMFTDRISICTIRSLVEFLASLPDQENTILLECPDDFRLYNVSLDKSDHRICAYALFGYDEYDFTTTI